MDNYYSVLREAASPKRTKCLQLFHRCLILSFSLLLFCSSNSSWAFPIGPASNLGQSITDISEYRDDQGCTLLHTASGRGQIEVVKDLLVSYDIISSKDKQGNTALHVAAYRGYLVVVDILVSSNPSTTSIMNNDGHTFLHMAVAGFRMPGFQRVDRQIELVKQLISERITDMNSVTNAKNNEGKKALHMAITENINSELVGLLLTSETNDLNIRDNDGMTPLDLLKQRPQSASSQLLMKQLKSVGGISHCQDEKSKYLVVPHLKMRGIGGSPGTSFRIPDADIVSFTNAESTSVFSYDPSTVRIQTL